MRPFRFGLVSTTVHSGRAWSEHARKVEDDGYSVLLVPDHIALPSAPVAAMTAAAAASSRLRVGSYVLANDFRHPVALAREAAAVDLLSDGRLELGLGAGWNSREYARAGIPFHDGRTRLARLKDAVRIITGVLAGGPVDISGEHFSVHGLAGSLTPVQRPVPLLLGGGGRQLLTFAARNASIVGLMGDARAGTIDTVTMGENAVRRRVGWVRDAAPAGGGPELNLFVMQVRCTGDRVAAAAEIARDIAADPAVILDSPHYMLGTREQLREQLLRLRERYGISYYSVFDRDHDAIAPIVADLAG